MCPCVCLFFRCEKKKFFFWTGSHTIHTNRIYMIGHCQSDHAWGKLERERKNNKESKPKQNQNEQTAK